jgi:hypothetical protein
MQIRHQRSDGEPRNTGFPLVRDLPDSRVQVLRNVKGGLLSWLGTFLFCDTHIGSVSTVLTKFGHFVKTYFDASCIFLGRAK